MLQSCFFYILMRETNVQDNTDKCLQSVCQSSPLVLSLSLLQCERGPNLRKVGKLGRRSENEEIAQRVSRNLFGKPTNSPILSGRIDEKSGGKQTDAQTLFNQAIKSLFGKKEFRLSKCLFCRI